MNVRARIMRTNDFYYPASDKPADLAEFWTVLEGYRLKGKEFELSYGTGVNDRENNEIYSKDTVTVYFSAKTKKTSNEIEYGVVEYVEGCFVVMNPAGLIWDLGSAFMEDDTFALQVTGNIYDNSIINE